MKVKRSYPSGMLIPDESENEKSHQDNKIELVKLVKLEKPCAEGWWGIVNQYNEIEQVVLIYKEEDSDKDYTIHYEDEYGNKQIDFLEKFLLIHPVSYWVGYIPLKLERNNNGS